MRPSYFLDKLFRSFFLSSLGLLLAKSTHGKQKNHIHKRTHRKAFITPSSYQPKQENRKQVNYPLLEGLREEKKSAMSPYSDWKC